MMSDKTCMSYWFPKIEAAGLPVPQTIMLDMPETAQQEIWRAIDNPAAEKPIAFEAFANNVAKAAASLGFPIFLRTAHTSGKHEWEHTCFVTAADGMAAHIFAIIYYSECAAMFGELPWAKWAVREYLPILPHGTCPLYGNMPVCREFRFFIDDHKVRCWHPYWPLDAIKKGGAVIDYEALCRLLGAELEELTELASRAGDAVGGSWSVDLLETNRGWYLTDMAEASKSFHWKGCSA